MSGKKRPRRKVEDVDDTNHKPRFFAQKTNLSEITERILAAKSISAVIAIVEEYANDYDLLEHCRIDARLQSKWIDLLNGSLEDFNDFFASTSITSEVVFQNQNDFNDFDLIYSYYLYLQAYFVFHNHQEDCQIKGSEKHQEFIDKLDVAANAGSLHAMMFLMQMKIGEISHADSIDAVEQHPAIKYAEKIAMIHGVPGIIFLADAYSTFADRNNNISIKEYCLRKTYHHLLRAERAENFSQAAIYNLSYGKGVVALNNRGFQSIQEAITFLDSQLADVVTAGVRQQYQEDSSKHVCGL